MITLDSASPVSAGQNKLLHQLLLNATDNILTNRTRLEFRHFLVELNYVQIISRLTIHRPKFPILIKSSDFM